MKKKIVIICNLILLVLFTLSQTGCASARELNQLVIVMGIGMDEDTENPENIKLIAQIVLPEGISKSQGGSSGSSKKPYYNIDSSAENSFEAVREFTHAITNKLYIAHNQIFVISRKIAERGIADYLDFFMRAKETRPTTTIVITEENKTAQEILNVEPEKNMLPAIHINKLIQAQVANSQSMETNVQNYISAMQSKTSSLVAPIVSIVEHEENQFLSVKGMAVFKGDKMVGELDENATRGLLWVLGKVQSGAINVKVDDQKVSSEITSAKTELSPKIEDGKIIMNVKITHAGGLTTQTGTKNLATEEGLEQIKAMVQNQIYNEITSALNKARELKTDIFGFGKKLHEYYNNEWKEIEKDWDIYFPTIEVKIEIESNISGVGIIVAPVKSGE